MPVDKDKTEEVRRRYDRTSVFYDWRPMDMGGRWRKELWGKAKGHTLEVGVGTGDNIKYYPEGLQVTGIDFSPGMLQKARRKAEMLGATVTLLEMDIQRMSFPDAAFDSVVATCVFCSVPDPVQGLLEVRRVLKPGGSLLLLEHVRSCRPLVGRLMDLLNPLAYAIVGTNINRNTLENLRLAGFADVTVRPVWRDILFVFETRRDDPAPATSRDQL